jgi:hypothetical protein
LALGTDPSITDVFFFHLDSGGFPRLNRRDCGNENSFEDNDDAPRRLFDEQQQRT